METISNLFKDLRERLSNPFLFSFIIAWCMINWKIVIGLIFYKIDHLKLDGYSSFIDLISKNHDGKNFYLYPILIALVYTFGFPLFKNLVAAFNHWANTWGGNWNMKISKKRVVSIEKYMQLRSNYETRSAMLEDVISKESLLIEENTAFNNEVLELKTANNSLAQKLKDWAFLNNPQILDGTWKFSYTTIANNERVIYEIQIEGGQFDILDQKRKMRIKYFYNNADGNMLYFALESPKKQLEFFEFKKIDNDIEILRGSSDKGKDIELKRKLKL